MTTLTNWAAILAIIWTVICFVIFIIIFVNSLRQGHTLVNAASAGLSMANVFKLKKEYTPVPTEDDKSNDIITMSLDFSKMSDLIPKLNTDGENWSMANEIFNQVHLSAWETDFDSFAELCRFYEDYVIPRPKLKSILSNFILRTKYRDKSDLPTDFVIRDYARLLFKSYLVGVQDQVSLPLINSTIVDQFKYWEPSIETQDDWCVDGGFKSANPGTLEMLRFTKAGLQTDTFNKAIEYLEKMETLLLHPTVHHNYASTYNLWSNTSETPTCANSSFGFATIPSMGYLRWNTKDGQFAVKAFKARRDIQINEWNDKIVERQLFGRVLLSNTRDTSRAGCFDVVLPHHTINTGIRSNVSSAVFHHNKVGVLHQTYHIPALLNAAVSESLFIDSTSEHVYQRITISNLGTSDMGYRDLNDTPHLIKGESIVTIESAINGDASFESHYSVVSDDSDGVFVLCYKKKPVLCWPKDDVYIPSTFSLALHSVLYHFDFRDNQLWIRT